MRIFFGHATEGSFVRRDLEILRSRHTVIPSNLCHKNPIRLLLDLLRVIRCQVAFFWFASLHALPCLFAARILGKKIAVVVGGYEAARVPEINYGQARFTVRRALTRAMLKAADLVLAVSDSSRQEIVRNLNISENKIALLYHGFEDMAGDITEKRKNVVISIGGIDRTTWIKKGIRDFIEVAARMPAVEFVHVGEARIDCAEQLGRSLPANLTLTGHVEYHRLSDHLSTAKVYVQMSRHESFGCSVAEAMLFGCIPVVSNAFALPEVVGDCGLTVGPGRTDDIIAAISEALELPFSERLRCRQRILTHFPRERRAQRLLEHVEDLRIQHRS